jgi:hypothetical protein
MTKTQIAGALVAIAALSATGSAILKGQKYASSASPATTHRAPQGGPQQLASQRSTSEFPHGNSHARSNGTPRARVDAHTLIGTWRPVLTEDARRDLIAKLGGSADDPEVRASLERAQRELEERRIEIDAGSITISQPGAAPLRQSYELAGTRGSRAELLMDSPHGGAPQRVTLQLVAPNQLLATLSNGPNTPAMTLRRVER